MERRSRRQERRVSGDTIGTAADAEVEDLAEESRQARAWETVRALLIAVIIAFCVRSFVIEPFKIPSGSMIPTLLIGDYILVNKFAYGLRVPFTNEVLVSVGDPTRGDVVVFRFPDDPSIDYIKRVVGIPGDKIEITGDRLYVNGQLVDRQPDGQYEEDEQLSSKRRFLETNVESDQYSILQNERTLHSTMTQTWVVPDDSYFMMGDNRDNSADSRKWQNHFVREDQLRGRAFMIHWSWVLGDGPSASSNFLVDLWDTLWKIVRLDIQEVRWDRIGRSIDGPAD
jgi:signal peptidase I